MNLRRKFLSPVGEQIHFFNIPAVPADKNILVLPVAKERQILLERNLVLVLLIPVLQSVMEPAHLDFSRKYVGRIRFLRCRHFRRRFLRFRFLKKLARHRFPGGRIGTDRNTFLIS